jgi:hypothetical protein
MSGNLKTLRAALRISARCVRAVPLPALRPGAERTRGRARQRMHQTQNWFQVGGDPPGSILHAFP